MPLCFLTAAWNQLFNMYILKSCINQKCCIHEIVCICDVYLCRKTKELVKLDKIWFRSSLMWISFKVKKKKKKRKKAGITFEKLSRIPLIIFRPIISSSSTKQAEVACKTFVRQNILKVFATISSHLKACIDICCIDILFLTHGSYQYVVKLNILNTTLIAYFSWYTIYKIVNMGHTVMGSYGI